MENESSNSGKVNTHVFVSSPDEDTSRAGHLKKFGKQFGKRCLSAGKENLLLILLLGSVIFGCAVGFLVRAVRPSMMTNKREVMYLMFPGEMLMRMLRMLILPLIMSSLISGIAGLDAKTCGKMGLRTIGYFASTTIISVVTGIIMCVTIQPGSGKSSEKLKRYGSTKRVNSVDTFLDLIRNMFPDNIITSCFDSFRTEEVLEEPPVVENATDIFTSTISSLALSTQNLTFMNDTVKQVYVPKAGTTGQTNVLGVVVFSVLMGVTLGRMAIRGKPLLDVCNCINEATMKLFKIFIWYSPLGITFLIAAKIVEMRDFGVLLGKVGLYFITVLCGLAVHGACILPALYFLCVRKNPYKFIAGIFQAMATAFGTSSSSATLPVTLHCLEHNCGVDPRVSSFVIPVGATINMDGTALYEAVAALFIAQVNNLSMDFGQIVTISITATAASIGAAGVPQAGLVTMVIVLSAVGLPTDDITLILVVDWFLDRFRTMINVEGDSLGAGIVYHLSKQELAVAEKEGEEGALTPFTGIDDKKPNGTDSAAITAV
ncbi:excitatory amino acid transporter 1-like [Octopus vulgaris]|uniref:Excitatory amino acid transporter 1-like n=2 Tax=Octopus TaxID=6643 RepID=A0AA36B5V4_OCTVU|nr:excitatory amino acid transporter 1 [Octopus sinensis]XP_036362664.1 excitatory amino acid transporter 1 [Octopus sinensis]XP_036362665.1 excitatory amino acid transporter 1 [Octopus sinensis]XP_036362666.1 excitatory amino acid transporter 1 [Octopus sinensis]CAI9727706.1 excitatory amino acid transporter 1-like [Octopus vulgaris]